MKKPLIISSIFGFVVFGAIIFALNNKADAPIVDKEINSSDSYDGALREDSQQTSSSASGKYLDYSPQVLADTSGEKVLFFHAPWCPQCRAIEKDILEQGVPEGKTIVKVDYDTNQDLRKKYGVTLQTTFVKVDEDGKEIKKYVAYNEPTLDAVKQNIL